MFLVLYDRWSENRLWINYEQNKDLWVKYLMEDMENTNPQKMADIILNEAVDNNFGKVKDDMSILVYKLLKK